MLTSPLQLTQAVTGVTGVVPGARAAHTASNQACFTRFPGVFSRDLSRHCTSPLHLSIYTHCKCNRCASRVQSKSPRLAATVGAATACMACSSPLHSAPHAPAAFRTFLYFLGRLKSSHTWQRLAQRLPVPTHAPAAVALITFWAHEKCAHTWQ